MLEESIVTHAISYLMSHNRVEPGENPTIRLSDITDVSGKLMNIFKNEFILQEDLQMNLETITVVL